MFKITKCLAGTPNLLFNNQNRPFWQWVTMIFNNVKIFGCIFNERRNFNKFFFHFVSHSSILTASNVMVLSVLALNGCFVTERVSNFPVKKNYFVTTTVFPPTISSSHVKSKRFLPKMRELTQVDSIIYAD